MDLETLKKLGLSVARGVPQLATGFVDLAALPLTATGIRQPEQIFGSTAYLTSKGLLPPPQEGMLNQSAELASSMINPAGLAKIGLLGATAYHGSPHLFNKFDISKLGTGEGAQTYGHGLYFAENPMVAEYYRSKLMPTQEFLQKVSKGEDVKGNLYKVDIPDEHIPKMLDWYKPLSEQTPEVQKALSNLPHRSKEWTFKNTLETLNAAPHTKEISGMNPTGQEIYSLLGNDIMVGNRASGQKYASDLLSKQGIKGIKYLDEGSRQNPYKVELYHKDKLYSESEFMQKPQAKQYMQQKLQEGFKPILKEQGTNNFVVFDPTDIKILERNNKGLLGD